MTKQNDRLVIIETTVTEIDRKVSALFNKIDGLCALDGPIVKAKSDIARTQTQTGIQWGFLGAILASIITLFLKHR